MSLPLGLLGVLSVGSGLGQRDVKARDVLVSCMQSGCKVNVTAILNQRDPSVEGAFQKIKLQRSKTGQSRHTVLQPLRMQGIESVDDGDSMVVYLPNDGVVIRRDSMAKSTNDLVERIDLASKNYVFKFEPKTTVAERTAFCVVATPHNRVLETRRFYIDEEKLFPLRLETEKKNIVKVLYDTVYIDFPHSMPSSTFKLSIYRDVKEHNYTRPRTVKDANEAASFAGFAPMIPRSLPFGFQIQDIQVKDATSRKTVMFQITDGLARATVYQWKQEKSDGTMKAMEDYSVGDKNGVRVMVISDMSEDIRVRLLKAFLQRILYVPEVEARFIGMDRKGRKTLRELFDRPCSSSFS